MIYPLGFDKPFPPPPPHNTRGVPESVHFGTVSKLHWLSSSRRLGDNISGSLSSPVAKVLPWEVGRYEGEKCGAREQLSQDRLGLSQSSVRRVSRTPLLFCCDKSLRSYTVTLPFIMMWHGIGKGNGFEKLEKRNKAFVFHTRVATRCHWSTWSVKSKVLLSCFLRLNKNTW